MSDIFSDSSKERPFECNECKKPVKVLYTEVIGDKVTDTVMCNDCPELEKRLHGISKQEVQAKSTLAKGLCCGMCHTTLEAIKTGHSLGCQECYEVFQDIIYQELIKNNLIPPRFAQLKPKETLHLGKMPPGGAHLSPSSKLIALNEALQATLAKEDYEQAALIRDEIKQLTEKSTDGQ